MPALIAAVGVLLAVVATVAWFQATGRSARDLPGASLVAPGEPQTVEAAKAAARKYFDRGFSGDAGGAWDMLSARSKGAESRADALAMEAACPTQPLPYEISDVRLDGPARAVVIIKVMGFAVNFAMVYEGSRWLADLPEKDYAKLARPVADRIAESKADGSCKGG